MAVVAVAGAVAAVGMAVVAATRAVAAQPRSWTRGELPPPMELPAVPVPPENPITEAKRVLGKALFWDVQLSSDNTVACGSCHMPAAGLADPAPRPHPGADGTWGTADDAVGSPGVVRRARGGGFVEDLLFGLDRQVTPRSAQGIGMAMFAGDLFWDGRARETFTDPVSGAVLIAEGGGLESHVLAPPVSDVEMAHEERDWPAIAERLARMRPLALATDLPPDLAEAIEPGMRYPALFARAFGDPAVTPARIAMAIATHERTLVPDRTPFDLGTMTSEQERGWVFFNDARTRCTECHVPPQFTNHEFRTIGLRPPSEDPGRMAVTGDPADAGAFKVPTLRNVGLKRSFMRDGRLGSLEEVLRFYHAPSRLQFRDNLDPVMPRIRVPGPWRRALVAFLAEGLTDPRVANETFPFDRPTLHEELDPNPRTVAPGTRSRRGVALGVLAPAPPSLGNDGFAVAVTGGPPGATARVRLFRRPPPRTGGPEPFRVLGPFTLAAGGRAGGHATWSWPVPDDETLLGDRLYVQWEVDDPSRRGRLLRAPVLELRFTRDDPRQGLVPGDLDGDGRVGLADAERLVATWGPVDLAGGDLDDDGEVALDDLLALLARWGDG